MRRKQQKTVGAQARMRPASGSRKLVTGDQAGRGPNCTEGHAGLPGGSDPKAETQSVGVIPETEQVGGARRGQIFQTSTILRGG